MWSKVWVKKTDMLKEWPIMKNPHLLFYSHETWWKWLPHEVIIFNKFHKDRKKNMDSLIMANFLKCQVFCYSNLSKLSILTWSAAGLSGWSGVCRRGWFALTRTFLKVYHVLQAFCRYLLTQNMGTVPEKFYLSANCVNQTL